MRKLSYTLLLSLTLFVPVSVLACSGAGEYKHVGLVTMVNAESKTFTIKDAETSSPITFFANEEILKGLKGFKGRVLVNYEEDVGGDLKAVGVTF